MKYAASILVVLCAALFLFVRHGFSARTEPWALEAWVAGRLRAWSIPSADRAARNPSPCTPADLAQARTHWADHCATCHANNGSGESLFGRTMYPRPPDMRLSSTQSQTDGELYYTIRNGVRLTGMPAFGDPSLGNADSDSWKLVCFIRHLPSLTSDEERAMRALNPKTPDELEEERREADFLNGR